MVVENLTSTRYVPHVSPGFFSVVPAEN